MRFFDQPQDFYRIGLLEKTTYIIDTINEFDGFLAAHPDIFAFVNPLVFELFMLIKDSMEIAHTAHDFLTVTTKVNTHNSIDAMFPFINLSANDFVRTIHSMQRTA